MPMLLGFALTRHCNLRCPHCIRDDVASVHSLPARLVFETAEQARELWGRIVVSFTGGEPTVHREWEHIIGGLAGRGIPYRFVTNGWHTRRLMPGLDRYPPQAVRVSLSGATRDVHDAERGRGSFDRVLMTVALLTSRRIPAALSFLVDRRSRHQIRLAADLAESLGCTRIHFILAQPVPASVLRGSDLPEHEWIEVRREVERLQADPVRRTNIQLDYGAPVEQDQAEKPCATVALERLYVDVEGNVSLCCQLSEYGGNREDVVGNLHTESLSSVYQRYVVRLAQLARSAAADPSSRSPIEKLPCLRCARSLRKLEWLDAAPGREWKVVPSASVT